MGFLAHYVVQSATCSSLVRVVSVIPGMKSKSGCRTLSRVWHASHTVCIFRGQDIKPRMERCPVCGARGTTPVITFAHSEVKL